MKNNQSPVDNIISSLQKKHGTNLIKCASGNIDQITKIIKTTPDDFIVLSGDDSMTYHIMALGGKGVVSVASNVFPNQLVRFTEAMTSRDWEFARQEQLRLYELFKILFIETNPGPVKYAAKLLNIMDNRMRLPLTPPLDENQRKIALGPEVFKRMLLSYEGSLDRKRPQ